MAVKPLECPFCHKTIETFDETTKKGFCPFCDALIADIPSWQHAYGEKTSGDAVSKNLESADKMLERIDGFVVIGKKDRTETLLREFTDRYPADFRGWNKLLELRVDMFVADSVFTDDVIECVNNMVLLAKTQEERNCLQKAAKTLHGMLGAIADKREAFRAEAQQATPKANQGFGDYALGGGCLGGAIGIIISLAMGFSVIEFGLIGVAIGALIGIPIALFNGLQNGMGALNDKDSRTHVLRQRLERLDEAESTVNTALAIIESGLPSWNR